MPCTIIDKAVTGLGNVVDDDQSLLRVREEVRRLPLARRCPDFPVMMLQGQTWRISLYRELADRLETVEVLTHPQALGRNM